MSATIYITVEDVAAQIALSYTEIQLHRADTVDGSYSEVGTATLVAGTFEYSIADSTGDLTKWYKYRYSDGASSHSDFSNVFRLDGVTRKLIRQYAIEKYEAGLVLASSTGGADVTATTTDYRLASAAYRANRNKGNFAIVTTGSRAGEKAHISASDPTASPATFTLSPALTGAMVSGDEWELHWLTDPDAWNRAINAAMNRYYHLERVPIVGVVDQDEYTLSNYPWLTRLEQITGLWHYPLATTDGGDDGHDEPWTGGGRWWNYRIDAGVITLIIKPTIAASKTVWLEATRKMPQLYEDAAVAHLTCNLELAAALAYDEVLSQLSAPGQGASDDRKAWEKKREEHAANELNRLLNSHRLSVRYALPVEQVPPAAPRPWRARN